jgi:hypothetical protein
MAYKACPPPAVSFPPLLLCSIPVRDWLGFRAAVCDEAAWITDGLPLRSLIADLPRDAAVASPSSLGLRGSSFFFLGSRFELFGVDLLPLLVRVVLFGADLLTLLLDPLLLHRCFSPFRQGEIDPQTLFLSSLRICYGLLFDLAFLDLFDADDVSMFGDVSLVDDVVHCTGRLV